MKLFKKAVIDFVKNKQTKSMPSKQQGDLNGLLDRNYGSQKIIES